jgi:hypothetical protein
MHDNTSTTERNKASIPWDTIPKTFQDAIIVTRKLGISYRWIDCLCIIQDNAQDCRVESAKIGSIYQNAYLTIGATKGVDSTSGLYNSIHPSHRAQEIPQASTADPAIIRLAVSHPSWMSHSTKYSDVESDMLLLLRGWAYQERLLSRKFVHFTNNELVWKCSEVERCECGHTGEESLLVEDRYNYRYNPMSYWNHEAKWNAIISHYSNLRLSLEEDKLPAIAGIARQVSNHPYHIFGNYAARCWDKRLRRDLV